MEKTKRKHNGKESGDKERKEESKQPNSVDDDSKDIHVPEDTRASPLHNETIYTVCRGQMYEGVGSSRTFISHANALKYVECLIARDRKSGLDVEWELDLGADDHWTCECDYIVIRSDKLDDYSRFKTFKEFKGKKDL